MTSTPDTSHDSNSHPPSSGDNTVAALIPARGGSKGLPGKNLATVGGLSLVARAIGAAVSVESIDAVFVSSDDPGILDEACGHDAIPIVRPKSLAASDTPMIDVVVHFLAERPGVGKIVILQPTSPLRTREDIEKCIDALSDGPVATTVHRVRHPVEWMFKLGNRREMQPVFGWDRVVTRRQDSEPTFQVNGAVYAAEAVFVLDGGALLGPHTIGVEIPASRAIDIDDLVDLKVARHLHDVAMQADESRDLPDSG